MATDPIDRISVEIETSSTVAENGVSALVRSLESLNSVLNKIADTDAAKALKNVGKTAQKASAETSVQAKQSVLTRATRTVRESPAAKQQEQIRQSVRYSRVPNSAAQKEWAQTVRYLQGNGEKPDLDQKINLSELKKSIKESEKIEIDMMKKLDGFYDKFKSIQGENIIGKNAESALGDAEQKLTQLRDSINETRDAAASLDDILKKIENGNGQDIKQSDINGLIEQYRMAGSAARSAGIEADNAMKTAKDAIAQAQAKADEMRESLFANRTIWSAIKSAASNALEDVKTKLAEAASQSKLLAGAIKLGVPIIGTLGSILGSVLRGGLTLLGKLWSGFKRLASTIAGAVVGGLQKLGSILKTVGGSVLNYVTKPFQRAISVIQKWKKTLGRLVFLRVVRSAIKEVTDGFKEGIENLYYFSSLTESQFKPAMDSLASSSLYLKNSLGAMADPLIQAVAPAVNYLIDLFVSLLNVINMVFSVLGGRTYTKALKTSAKYADDLDKSLGGGASSAKELQRYLIGIDQLTIIPDQPNSGGGGGGGTDLGAQYEEMFEEVPLPDWVLNIKDAINAGKWEQAGKLLAKKVNSLIDTLKKNAPSWGNKIGQAIQHGIDLGLGFIRDLDIEGFAASLTTIVGNAMNKVNPRDLGAIVASKIKSAFRFVHGLLEGYTGPDIGAYLAEVVNGWFAELRRDNGWKQAAEDLSNVIKGIIDGVATFLEDLDTASIEKDLSDFFGNIKWGDIWSSLEHAAEVAANAIPWQDMLNGLLNVAANALIFVHDTILKIPSTQATSGVWGTLQQKIKDGEPVSFLDVLSGLSAFFGDVIDYIVDMIPEDGWSGIWDTIKEDIASALTNGGTWDDLVEQIKEKIVAVIKEALNLASTALYQVVVTEHPKIARLLFPNAEAELYGGEFQQKMQTQGHDAAYAFLHELINSGTISRGSAQKIIEEAAAGIYDKKTSVTDAANSVMQEVDNILGGGGGKAGAFYGRSINVEFDATRTKKFEDTVSSYNGLSSKKTTLTAGAKNQNKAVFDGLEQYYSIIDDKTATLIGDARNGDPYAFRELKDYFTGINDKSAMLTGNGTSSQSLKDLKKLYNDLKDKSATVTGRGAQDKSLTNVKGTYDSIYNKSATLSAYANNKNPSTLSALQYAWQTIVTKSVALSATVAASVSNALSKLTKKATGGIFAGGAWHDIAGYAGGGTPKRARLFYANENGMPELIGRIGGNTAVMNNGQIVASVSSGVYRAVSAAMGGVGSYFGSIANSMSRIPEVLSNIVPVHPQPIMVGAGGPSYEMDMSVIGRSGRDGMVQRSEEENEEVINAIYAMGQRIISAINNKDTNLYFDTQRVGSSTTDVQNRQNRMYGKTQSNG